MLYTIENECLRAGINSLGAELTTLTDLKDGQELMWCGDPAVWSGHSPLLFPIVGRLLSDRYTLEGKSYSLPKHGFARREEFTLTEQRTDALTLTFSDWEKHYEAYPFRFSLEVTFRLEGRVLHICHTVHNEDERTMYFSLGAHPAIAAVHPVLTFPEEETVCAMRFGENMVIRDERTPFLDHERRFFIREHTFDEDAYILEGLRSPYVDVQSADGGPSVRVHFGGAPYVGIWAKPGADYVCIEPWEGLDDDLHQSGELSEKKGIVSLAAGESHCFSIGIERL